MGCFACSLCAEPWAIAIVNAVAPVKDFFASLVGLLDTCPQAFSVRSFGGPSHG